MPKLNTSDKITRVLIDGIMNRQVVRIRYEKTPKVFKRPLPEGRIEDGDTVTRTIEPYEIKHEGEKEFLWGFDPKAKHIKKFNLEGVKSARLLSKVFKPKEEWIQTQKKMVGQ
jgi:predicted DNA-binding transcriptional regulator YafY